MASLCFTFEVQAFGLLELATLAYGFTKIGGGLSEIVM